MSSRYAENTSVSVEKSKAEIERILQRYGADAFSYATDQERAVVQFRMAGKIVRLQLTMPDRNDEEFQYTPSRGYKREPNAASKAWEQACRQRWRALALVIKAKLEAVETGITTFEEEFLSSIVLPDNSTVAQFMIPQVVKAYEVGEMPLMLPSGSQ